MQNPISQILNGNNQNKQNNSVNILKTLLYGKNPKALYTEMIQTNPQFRKFVKDNEGKTIEDIAMEYDIDLSILNQFL